MRTLFLALLAFTAAPAFAQFSVTNPYVEKTTCRNLYIEEVHVFPDKITLDFLYVTDAQNGGYRWPSESYIHFNDFDEKSYVSGLKNADYSNYTYVKGKKGHFSASFPFSYFDMLTKNANALQNQAARFPFLKVDVIGCSQSYLSANNNDESRCFNFYGVDLGLPPDQVEALFLCGLLDKSATKGEFETTAAFTKRNSPDSLRKLLSYYIDNIESIYEEKELNIMASITPTVSYDADKETFTITYVNCEPFLMKIPIAQAPAFKQALQDKTIKPASSFIVRKASGNFYVKEIEYKEKGKDASTAKVYSNLVVEETDKLYQATEIRVLGELKKIYAKGQVWR